MFFINLMFSVCITNRAILLLLPTSKAESFYFNVNKVYICLTCERDLMRGTDSLKIHHILPILHHNLRVILLGAITNFKNQSLFIQRVRNENTITLYFKMYFCYDQILVLEHMIN